MARRKSHGDEWYAAHPEVVRCKELLKTTGQQCAMEAHPGATVCFKHGANLPQVQAAAARRIQGSVEDAVKRLQAMLDDPSVENREKVKILHDLLDRGGLGATNKLLVGVAELDPVETLFRDLLGTPGALALPSTGEVSDAELAKRRAAWAELVGGDDGDVVDAELVEEPAEDRAPDAIEARNVDRPQASAKMPKRVAADLAALQKADLW